MSWRPSPARRGDILVVDDTPENILLLSAVLKDRGYRVRAVPSGALALRAVESEAPDLILLDVSMPGMDGYEVCRRLKQREGQQHIPIIFLSALSDTADKVKAFSVGGVDYVTKPFRVEEIAARVETHLSIGRLRSALRRSHEELERSHLKLQELERLRQALVQMIVHDLKSPIAAIQLNAGIIRGEGVLTGDLRVAVDDILSSGKTMSRMVVDVLDVARTEEASLRPRFAPVALRALLDEVLGGARAAARDAGKSLAVAVADDVPEMVVCDRELLRRVVENVLDNCFKYAPAQTVVRLEAVRLGPAHYALHIRDQGPGIPAEYRDRVFEPYARLERDFEAHARVSRGLGLAFCRMAAEAHQGRIWVEDNPPGGSLFVLRLPIDPVAAAADEQEGARNKRAPQAEIAERPHWAMPDVLPAPK